jgi:competence protein ComEC
MNSINTAFIKVALFFVAGILAGFLIEIPFTILFSIFSVAFVVFLWSFWRAKELFLQDVFFGVATFLLFFLTGITTTQLHLPQNQPNHYINLLSSETDIKPTPFLMVSISEELKPDLYNRKFIAEVEQLENNSTHGKLLLLMENDSSQTKIAVDDRMLISAPLQTLPAPLNPHQFNYRTFMQNRGVLNQVQLKAENFEILDSGKNSIKGWAASSRAEIVKNLKENNFRQEELGIIQALLLGQRQDISEEIYNNYAAAGVIHILAVSGLHVGIILWLLHRLFSPLERKKKGRVIKTFILIVLLWLFALLAGLSPSVVRAVTMFSFVAVGLQIKRRTSVMNTLFMSMMVLLLVRPQFIFEVGFQLSYLAVFSIVLLQPMLYKLLEPKNQLIKYFWGLLTVTIAAQAGVLPLSLFYFHQFPGLFFISNLVILPFMGLILALGIVVMILALLNLLPIFLTEFYSFLISSLNNFVELMAKKEEFLFQDIPFSGPQTIGFYFILAALYLLLKRITSQRILLVLSAVLVLQIIVYKEIYQSSAEEVVVFHKSRNTIIGKKTGQQLLLHHNLAEAPQKQNIIKNYIVGENIQRTDSQNLQHFFAIGEDIMMVIDSAAIYSVEGLQPDYVLLTNSPKINLNRLLKTLQPKVIIADGSNYRSYLERWEETCLKENIPFHATAKNGAFIIR